MRECVPHYRALRRDSYSCVYTLPVLEYSCILSTKFSVFFGTKFSMY
jgi:hypothetical protein